MRFRLSKLAQEDIGLIDDYTVSLWGIEQADRYIAGLLDALEEIQLAPERWRLREDIHPGSRLRVYQRHLILYRIRNGTVEVGRILHGAMNLSDHVPEDFMGEG